MRKVYFPTHEKNRMRQEGDVGAARKYFFENKNQVLRRLIQQRYEWMNEYMDGSYDHIMELGCGAGLSKEFIQNKNLLLTDVLDNPWVDKYVDALNLDFPNGYFDVIICSHMIHHLANPATFLENVSNKLKIGGRIIIQDINTSWIMKMALRVMRHEGYSENVDVFSKDCICNEPSDPWSANCSIPKLLFSDSDLFERSFPMFKIIKNELKECFLFFLSGGVIAKTYTPPLRGGGVEFVVHCDRKLVKAFPAFFACGRSVVLERVK